MTLAHARGLATTRRRPDRRLPECLGLGAADANEPDIRAVGEVFP